MAQVDDFEWLYPADTAAVVLSTCRHRYIRNAATKLRTTKKMIRGIHQVLIGSVVGGQRRHLVGIALGNVLVDVGTSKAIDGLLGVAHNN